MCIDVTALLKGKGRPHKRKSGAGRRRREDQASKARLIPPPSPYSSGFVNELGAWCGVGQAASRRGATYVWIPWDTAQVRRYR
jgi:hypothetical protein